MPKTEDKKFCYRCKHSGSTWFFKDSNGKNKGVKQCHCEHISERENAGWGTVRSVFDSCDNFEDKRLQKLTTTSGNVE